MIASLTNEFRRVLAPLLALLINAACASTPRQLADRVFVNGAVYTVDAQQSWAQAVAIADGEIIYVGDDAGARPFIGADTEVVDLHGRMMSPGFHDGHAHVLAGGPYNSDS